ncbi:MAG: hypothetical protein SGJ11_04095 [Phycisphaerae bacterium]|nr:hypothetical protein [Phycisphaerae bacterium]
MGSRHRTGVGFGGPAVSIITDPSLVDPKGLAFDDAGHLFVSTFNGGNRAIMELENIKGEWAPRAGSVFTGLPSGDRCDITRSRSNFDPETSEPFAPNMDPSEILVSIGHGLCDTDLDGSDSVDGADLAILLGSWGTNATLADIDHNGVIDAADLAALLGAWGACP